jgi:hypothetical protein
MEHIPTIAHQTSALQLHPSAWARRSTSASYRSLLEPSLDHSLPSTRLISVCIRKKYAIWSPNTSKLQGNVTQLILDYSRHGYIDGGLHPFQCLSLVDLFGDACEFIMGGIAMDSLPHLLLLPVFSMLYSGYRAR